MVSTVVSAPRVSLRGTGSKQAGSGRPVPTGVWCRWPVLASRGWPGGRVQPPGPNPVVAAAQWQTPLADWLASWRRRRQDRAERRTLLRPAASRQAGRSRPGAATGGGRRSAVRALCRLCMCRVRWRACAGLCRRLVMRDVADSTDVNVLNERQITLCMLTNFLCSGRHA